MEAGRIPSDVQCGVWSTRVLWATIVAGMCGFLVLGAAGPSLADEADDQFAVATGHFRAKRWQLAGEELREFLRRWPADRRAVEAKFFLGEAYVELQQYREARDLLRELASAEPTFANLNRVLFRIGQASWRLGDDKAAQQELKGFVDKFPKDPLVEVALPYLGDAALSLGQFEQARSHYEQALQRFPKGRLLTDCRYGLARALERLGETPKAIELYRSVAATTHELADDAQLNLGARLFELKRYSEAVEVFRDLPRKFPESPLAASARLHEGWALYQLQSYPQAAELFGGLVGHPQLGGEAQYWQGLSYKAMGKVADAAKVLLEAAKNEKDPLAADMLFQGALALFQAGDYSQAAEHFLRVPQRWPEAEAADDSLYYACQSLLRLKAYELVVNSAQLLADRYPRSPLVPRAQTAAGQALVAQGAPEKAIALLRPVVGGPAADTSARYYLGLAYQARGKHAEARETLAPLEKADAKDPMVAGAHYVMGVSEFALGHDDAAARLLQRYLAVDPEGELADSAMGQLALCHARSGDFGKAQRQWNQLLEKDPQNWTLASTALQLAEIGYARAQWPFAESLFSWIAKSKQTTQASPPPQNERLDPYARAVSGIGWCQFQQKQFAKSADTFGTFLADYADHPLAAEAAFMRGRALESAGKAAEAAAAYDLVVQRYAEAPQAGLAGLQRARLLAKERDYAKAAEAYRRLAERFPQFGELDRAVYEWAWVYVDMGDEKRANAVFLDLARRFPNSPLALDALLNVAESHYQNRRYDAAMEAVGQVRSKLGGAKDEKERARLEEAVLYRLGRIAADQAKWEDLKEPLSRLIEGYPKSRLASEARFWLAEADYRLGQYEAADKRFQELLAANESTPLQDWMGTAWLRRAQVLAQRGQWKDSLAAVQSLKKRFPKYELTYEADYLEGRCLSNTARFDEARKAFARCIASPQGQKTETAAQAQLMIGETYFHQKDYSRALRAFLRVEILYDYPVWQAAGLLQAGKCSEQLGQWNQAADCYRRILDDTRYAQTEFAKEARERLEVVKKTLSKS